MRALGALLLLLLHTGAAQAATCRSDTFDGARFTWCRIDMTREDLRLWLTDDEGDPLGTFTRLEQALAAEGRRVGIAMNAGMYHQDRAPVGLYIENGREISPIVTSAGPGNFGLLPNGVFCIGDGTAQVIESRAFARNPPACRFATQSGPMLLLAGKLHPRFLPDSTSLYVRNGVGIRDGGREAILALSEQPVSFHHFARFFRDVARTPNALYLDGNISRLYAPALDRHDTGVPMGPILGTAVPADVAAPAAAIDSPAMPR